MAGNFNFKSALKGVQNRLISQSIRDTANLDIVKSEDALRSIVKSYTDKFNVVEGMLFDAAKYVAESNTVVTTTQFNDIFESLYIDLNALYSDLETVDKVLSLNLNRNKNYFLIIKKRMRDLWKKLAYIRRNVYDDDPSDESFYESFFTDIDAARIENIKIDKKSGFMHLEPVHLRIQNQAHQIKNITSTTYPAENDEGGVNFTTNILNTFEENYTKGPRDMLRNGLWKEEVITSDIPSMNIDVTGNNNFKNFKGVVSLVDIEYTKQIEMNRMDIDVFGDFPLTIDSIFYKASEDDSWTLLNYEDEVALDLTRESIPESSWVRQVVRGEAFDVISFYNIDKINAKFLRIVLNQENYIFLDSTDVGAGHVNNKLQKDLSERRYEVVRFGANIEDMLSAPVTNDDNSSLYARIIEVIESTKNVEEILFKIDLIINPRAEITSYDFARTAKFEVGTWSIEPKIEKYIPLIGKYDSKPKKLGDKSLVSVSLNVQQKTPEISTCNWYIGVNNKSVPVIQNNESLIKEPINPIVFYENGQFSDWTDGTFVLLDLPVDPFLIDLIAISEEGQSFDHFIYDNHKILFLNSRLIYLPEMSDPFRSHFVISYYAAKAKAVNLYKLTQIPGADLTDDLITVGIVSTKKEILEAFLETTTYTSTSQALKASYRIVPGISTINESEVWLGSNFDNALFINDILNGRLTYESKYNDIINVDISKGAFTIDGVNAYKNFTEDQNSDFALIGTPGVAPLNTLRSI